jgi:hypothetical protein
MSRLRHPLPSRRYRCASCCRGPWAVFGGLLALLVLYFIGAEQGAMSMFSGNYVHEFVHDGRHLLGFPCH